jgi:hypothetical protein
MPTLSGVPYYCTDTNSLFMAKMTYWEVKYSSRKVSDKKLQ